MEPTWTWHFKTSSKRNLKIFEEELGAKNLKSEIKNPRGWLQAFIILLIASLILEAAEIFYGRIFSPEFKISIFYIPAVLCLILYLTLRLMFKDQLN
jgi:hypothetical protein